LFDDRHRFFTQSFGPMTAVAAWHASPGQKAAALSAVKAREIVLDLYRGAFDAVQTFGTLYTIATSREPHPRRRRRGPLDSELAAVEAAVSQGALLLVRGWDLDEENQPGVSAAADRGTPEGKLLRQVLGNAPTILFENRRYRLVPARLWSEAGQGRYRIMAIVEARTVIAHLSQRPTNTTDQKAAWDEIAKQLSESRHGNGLLLLRETMAGGPGPAKSSEPALTPSQLKPKVEEKDWIEVQVLFSDGAAFDGRCSIELPGGRKVVGPPGKAGTVRIDSVDPGQCNVTFPDLDSAMWELA